MGCLIAATSGRGVGQIEAAVNDNPIVVSQMVFEDFWRN
jgi:hypothetical protein